MLDKFLRENLVHGEFTIGKFKIAEHEQKALKKFFDTWNDLRNGTIDKENVSFISWFIKFHYGEELKSFIDEEIRFWEITQKEFDEGGEKCEKLLDKYDNLYIEPEFEYIFDNLENSNPDNYSEWTRRNDDYNERLNRILSYSMSLARFSKPFIYKYSMCPHKIDERRGEE